MKKSFCKFILSLTLLLTTTSMVGYARASSAYAPRIKTTKRVTGKNSQAINDPQLNVVAVHSKKMGRDINNLIVVPKQYLDGGEDRYPVVYLLHGYGSSDNHMSWHNHIDLAQLATKYRMIFVCPDGQNSWYFDSPIDPKFQFETFITKELREWVDVNYRTIGDAKHRAITGLSMGGHGALWLAFRHPDIYGSCGSMSGAVDFNQLKSNFMIDKRLGARVTHQQAWKTHSVISLVPNLKNGQNIIIDDGAQDNLCIAQNRALHAALEKKGIRHRYSERPGQHSWSYWVVSIKQHLDFFTACFK